MRRMEHAGRAGQAGRAAAVAMAALLVAATVDVRGEADKYDVYAVRFATVANFPVSSLIAGADRSRRLDIAMMFWVLKGADGRIALVDSGFHRERYLTRFAGIPSNLPAEVHAACSSQVPERVSAWPGTSETPLPARVSEIRP